MITRLAAAVLLTALLFPAYTERDVDASAVREGHKRTARPTPRLYIADIADSHALAVALENHGATCLHNSTTTSQCGVWGNISTGCTLQTP